MSRLEDIYSDYENAPEYRGAIENISLHYKIYHEMNHDKDEHDYFLDTCLVETKAFRRYAKSFLENNNCLNDSAAEFAFYSHIIRMQQNEMHWSSHSSWYKFLINFIASEVEKNPAPISQPQQNLQNAVRNLFDLQAGFKIV